MSKKISEADNKILDTSSLVITTVDSTKIIDLENKIFDHAKYITTYEYKKLRAGNIVARLKEANLVDETDFDNKLISINRKITSNKRKYLAVQTN